MHYIVSSPARRLFDTSLAVCSAAMLRVRLYVPAPKGSTGAASSRGAALSHPHEKRPDPFQFVKDGRAVLLPSRTVAAACAAVRSLRTADLQRRGHPRARGAPGCKNKCPVRASARLQLRPACLLHARAHARRVQLCHLCHRQDSRGGEFVSRRAGSIMLFSIVVRRVATSDL
jgi:hypothetical protein